MARMIHTLLYQVKLTAVVGLRILVLMTKPYTPLTEYQMSRVVKFRMVRCDKCQVWTDVDDFVWRGPDLTVAICDACQEEGDQ